MFKEIISEHEVEIVVYGSATNGLAIKDESDIDISLIIKEAIFEDLDEQQ